MPMAGASLGNGWLGDGKRTGRAYINQIVLYRPGRTSFEARISRNITLHDRMDGMSVSVQCLLASIMTFKKLQLAKGS